MLVFTSCRRRIDDNTIVDLVKFKVFLENKYKH